MALVVAQPANTCRQALELHVLLGGVEPVVQVLVVREELLERLVGDLDVLRVAGECCPAERAQALTEERADVGRDEARELEGALVAGLAGLVADGVAVVEDLGTLVLEFHHGLDLGGHGLAGLFGEGGRVGLGLVVPILDGDFGRQVAQRVMRGGLVRDNVHGELSGALAAQHLREDLGGVAHETHGQRLLVLLGVEHQLEGLIQVANNLIEVALMLAALQAGLIHIDDEAGTAVQGHGQRLCTAHAAAATGEGKGAGERAVEALLCHGREGLEGTLQDALGSDVNPGAGRHLAVHHQAFIFELAEVLPIGPVTDKVGVGDEHTRCPLVGLPDTHRLAGLHQEGLVGFEVLQGLHDGIEGLPAAGSASGTTVDHEVLGTLGNLGVKVVHEHAQRGFGLPRLGGDFGSARGAYFAGFRHDFLSLVLIRRPPKPTKAGFPGLSLVGLGQRHTGQVTVTQDHEPGHFWPSCLRYETAARLALQRCAGRPRHSQRQTQKCRPGSAYAQVGIVKRQGSA